MEKVKKFIGSKVFLYVLIALFCLFLACLSSDYDYDLYARLIVGENFIEQGVFNYKDFYSYTPTHVWYDHEWGASIIFYLFLKIFGPFGLILIQGILLFVTVFFVMQIQKLQRHAYPCSLAFITLFLVLFSHQNPSIVRCHLFSFAFFSIFLYLLEYHKKTNSNIIWWIPFITILWNNIHGGVVSGLGIVFIYLVTQVILKKPFKKLLFVLLVSVGVLIINPYGIEYIKFLLAANTMSRKFITEWWDVFASRHIVYYYPQFCFSVFTIILCFLNYINKKKTDLTKIVLLLVTTYLGTIHVKLLSLTLIVIAALFYNDLMTLVHKRKLRFVESITVISLIIFVLCIPFTKPLTARTNITKHPVKEVEFLKINNIHGNILSEFGYSSYIAYKLYPNNLIYLDGRYEEVYNDNEFNKLMHYELIDEHWLDILNDYPTEILMPDKNIPVYSAIEKNKDWVKIYEGDVCGIFVKRKNVRKKYLKPSDDINYYQKNEFVNKGYFGKNGDLKIDN